MMFGSSPRGRGKRVISTSEGTACRLIPAWAGKTRTREGRHPHGWAHPRVGGENLSVRSCARPKRGSSPRGRGKRVIESETAPLWGLIPAWAGKTHPRRNRPRRRWAHPRVGGENGFGDLLLSHDRGSSPRGRGKLATVAELQMHLRLIPAWAGKTPRCGSTRSRTSAHPRVGGENWRRR